MVNADDLNTHGKNINIIKKNKEALLQAGRDVSLEVDTEKAKYMVVSHHQM
jgi:hypothetical protein